MNDDLGTTDAALTAFEQAPVMLWQCEGDPLVVTACNVLARARFGERAGDGVHEVFGDAGARPSLADRLVQVLATGEPFTLRDHRLAGGGADGVDEVFADVVAHPCRDDDGSVTGVAAMAVDTTDAVRARSREADRARRVRCATSTPCSPPCTTRSSRKGCRWCRVRRWPPATCSPSTRRAATGSTWSCSTTAGWCWRSVTWSGTGSRPR